MLASVEFDDQPRFDTAKIDHEPTDRRLKPELKPSALAVPERLPNRILNIGPLAAEARGVGADLAADGVHAKIVK